MKNNSVYRTAIKNYLGPLFTVLFLTSIAIQVSAQKTVITAALSKHGVDPVFLDPANLRLPLDQTFDLKESTNSAGKVKVLLAKFDAKVKGREQWTVISVDGKTPSLYETNTFRNTRSKPPVDKPDGSTYRIESESPEQMVISYKIAAATIPMDAAFLKDCHALLTIDLKNKQLKQLQLINEKPVKIGPLTAKKFEITTKYNYDKQTGRYFPVNDELNMEASFLGRTLTTQVATNYSNYSKVR